MFVVTDETSLFESEQQRVITDANDMFDVEFKDEIAGKYQLTKVIQEPPKVEPETKKVVREQKREPKHQALIKNSTGSKIFEFLEMNKPSAGSRKPVAAPKKEEEEEPVRQRRKLRF